MKLFIREQMPLVFVYLAQLLLILFVFWVDGYRNYSISLYAALLSGCLLIGYLVYRYVTHRNFYKRLEEPHASLEETLEIDSEAPVARGVHQLLRNQYRFYQNDIQQYQFKLKNHIHFINQWVHQMKTPLSVIHLMIQDEDEPKFTAIADELDRMKKGLDMVLYTARLDEFEHDFYVEMLPLEKVARSVTSNQKRLFIRNRVFPSLQMEEGLNIASDEKWLSFVLTQIITNAVRYTKEENQKIILKGFKRGANVILEVQDQGVGIPASDLPRVFDPYFTGENGRNFQESTGMGLFLVKQICDKLGHTVEIESQQYRGTTVRIIF
ncbi:HAMP domain-containing histidine kinase [Neobacillus niacini]|uniref:HAMP domain-containing histidine kinase n=1 Tax=Neobacillus niacini TaxID=86668 RepID=UPI001C8D6E96|nr:HAMP domain-containing histidine kinase [Neobacillus niacini]MBY0147728.1 HAMP domain-containing histidine kinase [Neobacillus niacini]